MTRWLTPFIVLGALLVGVPHAPAGSAAQPDRRPDIVLILMDDFSLELLATMPEALRMKREGASYSDAFVVDSLCCPSRTSLFTGRYPHQTGVLTNTPNDGVRPIGGFEAYRDHDNQRLTFAVTLQEGGYRTGFIGKFLNGYDIRRVDGEVRTPRRQPGWTDWQPIFRGYSQWNFLTSKVVDGEFVAEREWQPPLSAPRTRRDAHYGTNVTADEAVAFIREHRDDARPYLLEVATYAPHAYMRPAYDGDPPFPAAFQDRPTKARPWGNCGARRCQDLALRDLKGYADPRGDNAPTYLRPGGRTAPAPAWRTNRVTLSDKAALRLYRQRARMVQSVDRLLARVRAEVGPDAYVLLSADNGYHLGQHRLDVGKGTPYDSDTRVPLIVVGPDVVPGTRSQVVNNIDLAATFEDLGDVPTPGYRSGRSFAASLRDPLARGNRYAFFEHTHAASAPGEVDHDQAAGGTASQVIPSYVAVRSARGLLVRVDLDNSWRGHRYAWELYRYDVPWEDRNVFAQAHDKPWVRDLKRRLLLFDGCTPSECRDAAR